MYVVNCLIWSLIRKTDMMIYKLEIYVLLVAFFSPLHRTVNNVISEINDQPFKDISYYKNSPPTFEVPKSAVFIRQKSDDKVVFDAVYDQKKYVSWWVACKIHGGASTGSRPASFYTVKNLGKYAVNLALEKVKEKNGNFLEQEKTIKIEVYNKKIQAHDGDYNNLPSLTRGHLAASMFFKTRGEREAANYLINIVPQYEQFNDGSWRISEENLKNKSNTCEGDMFAVTGIVPGDNTTKHGINIPAAIWTAYCCAKDGEGIWSGAVFGENTNEDNGVSEMSLKQLQEVLLNNNIAGTVFEENCADNP